MSCLNEFYQISLCTKITRVRILVISVITSFNMTIVTPNTCLCPGPHSGLKHITKHDSWSSQLPNASTYRKGKKIIWGYVRGRWWTLWGIIQPYYRVVEELLQSVFNNYSSMSRFTFLPLP